MSFRFERNLRVRIGDEPWVFRRKLGDDRWQLESLINGKIVEYTRKELWNLASENGLVPIFEDDDRPTTLTAVDIPKRAQDMIDLRMKYVLAVDGIPISEKSYTKAIEATRDELLEEAKKSPPMDPSHAKKLSKLWGWTTVYRWLVRYRSLGRDSHSLLHKRRHREISIPARLLEIIEDAIDTVYLTRERKTLQDTLDHAREEVRQENEKRQKRGVKLLAAPGLRVLNRVRGTIKAFDQYAARFGRQAAIAKFRSVKGHVTTTRPLERAEIDHTPLDLFVVDDETWLPLGRPYLTVCIDDYTRCVLGIKIDFVDPSYESLATCLKSAFRPKDAIRDAFPEIEHVDDIFGIPSVLVVDQALEFHAHSFVKACARLGITIQYSARKTPWNKGKVERFMRTINAEIAHGAKGTTFRSIAEKGDYNPEKHATVRLSTLKKVVHMWVYDVYHQRKHRALDVSPAEMWAKSINYDDIPIPEEQEALNVILGKEYDRVLTHKGIEFERLFYNSDELASLRLEYGPRLKVKISVNVNNIGSIYVLYGQHRIKVPALRQDYAEGITLWQHRKFREMAKVNAPTGWLTAKERIRRIYEEEFLQKRKRRRGTARAIGSRKGKDSSSQKQPQMKSDEPTPSEGNGSPAAEFAMPLTKEVPTYSAVIQSRTNNRSSLNLEEV